ncbi:putative bifunctional diguanylate cyclase/phosphodiesterase [Corallincola spongiicola]|uniref:EAL domain-containing protein n=1 Tax=Corallincola spongiicola TaxID=2520508 RepID=A0ABY1WMB6_9GAMM|nr:EAL domain-containing protein [Corallincola spongiicola]TAA42659.1 EAL domain-containing protein [Corallincola spongiicola]
MALHSGRDLSFRIFLKTLLLSGGLAFAIWAAYVGELVLADFQQQAHQLSGVSSLPQDIQLNYGLSVVSAFDTPEGRLSATEYVDKGSAIFWQAWLNHIVDFYAPPYFSGIYWTPDATLYVPLANEPGAVLSGDLSILISQQIPATHGVIRSFAVMVVLLPFFITFAMYRQRSKLSRQARALASLAAKQAGLSSQFRLNNDTATVIETAVKKLSSKLELQNEAVNAAHLADKLTGLANRQQFQLALEKAILQADEGKQKLALLFIDLDGFKQVNDTFGHSVGDGLLVEVANRLNAATRSSDTISLTAGETPAFQRTLARLGGDEFTVILSNIQVLEEAEQVSARIIELLEQEFRFGEHRVNISASIGIAVYPQDGQSPENLLQMADVAMYKAKSDGKGTFRVYLPEMGREVRRQHYLSNEIRRAVNDSEFSLEFQPIIEIASNQIAYFEALLRWHHPHEGQISPGEFIPIAEETRQILPLGDYVLYEAMQQMEQWNRAGLRKARVSVNVSSVQLKQLALREWVEQALQKTKLPPSCLMIEITESYLMEATGDIIAQIDALRQMGVKVAIDDFGTGYSSLSSLASLPIDVLKIDRSFVNKASSGKKYRRILASIVALAKELDLTIVAEGVETAEELELLKSMKCQYIQGFLISRPQTSKRLNHTLFNKRLSQVANSGTGVWSEKEGML